VSGRPFKAPGSQRRDFDRSERPWSPRSDFAAKGGSGKPGPRRPRPDGDGPRGQRDDDRAPRPRRDDDRAARPRRDDDRGQRPFTRRDDDGGKRPYARKPDDRGPRRDGDGGKRPYPRRDDDRGPRRDGDGGKRPFARRDDDRGPRRDGDGGPRPFARRSDDRGPRRDDDRGPRPFARRDGADGPRRDGDGGKRPFVRRDDDRGPRPFARRSDDRGPRRDGDGGPRPFARRSDDRGPRRDGPRRDDDRAPRPFRNDGDGPRRFRDDDRTARPRRDDEGGFDGAPQRARGPRDQRRIGQDDRPKRTFRPDAADDATSTGSAWPESDAPAPIAPAATGLVHDRIADDFDAFSPRGAQDDDADELTPATAEDAAAPANAPRGLAPGEMKYYGLHTCQAIFENRAADIIRVYVAEERVKLLGPLMRWCAEQRKAYHVVSSADLDKIAASVHHEGVCVLAKEPRRLDDAGLLAKLRDRRGPTAVVFLDGVQNPHNIGSIMRVAAHFGAPFIVGRDRQLPRLSGSAVRVAEGGLERVTLAALADPTGTLVSLRALGYELVATSSHGGDDLYKTSLPERCIIVLGAEGPGMSAELNDRADRRVRIPGTNAIESLNVSVAAGLLLGEFWRQRATTASSPEWSR
jgi:TrmH RNA methyltransferase